MILPSREASRLQCVERRRHDNQFTTRLGTVIVHRNIKHSRTVISELEFFLLVQDCESEALSSLLQPGITDRHFIDSGDFRCHDDYTDAASLAAIQIVLPVIVTQVMFTMRPQLSVRRV